MRIRTLFDEGYRDAELEICIEAVLSGKRIDVIPLHSQDVLEKFFL